MSRFNTCGVTELSAHELRETSGGILPLLAIGAALLLSGCSVTIHENPPQTSPTPKTAPDSAQ